MTNHEDYLSDPFGAHELAPVWLTKDDSFMIGALCSVYPESIASDHLYVGLVETVMAAERIGPYIIDTPLVRSDRLSTLTGNDVFRKREDLQAVRSFKIRGATNKLLQLSDEERGRGVLSTSAGNHAQGIASASQQLGIKATIVMPTTTPDVKIEAVKGFGAEVILVGDNYSEAQEYTESILDNDERTFIHPFDDIDVIHGQGTIGFEILRDCPDVTHVFIPGGGGGLAAGVSKVIKALRPEVKIIVVEPEGSNCIQLSFQAGRPVSLPKPPTIFADGVAVQQPGDLTMREILSSVDEVLTVSDDDISAAIVNMWRETGTAPEGAGALAEAGMINYANANNEQGQQYVGIVSGSNISSSKFRRALEREGLGSHKEALFSVKLPERAGSLRKFCSQVVNGHGITELHYRRRDDQEARTFVGFSMNGEQDKANFIDKMEKHVYSFDDLSDDDFAKEHLRYLAGGSRNSEAHEAIYVVDLPERSGSLAEFLDALHDKWSISLFHYRSFGEITPVLIGFQTDDPEELEAALTSAGYSHSLVESPAIEHFL